MKQFLRHIFLLLAMLFMASNAWAGQAHVYAKSDPTDGGYVHVATSQSEPTYTTTDSHAEQGGFMGSGNKTFYLYYTEKAGYKFKGWLKTDENYTCNTNSTTNTTDGWKVTQSATGFGAQNSYYVAIFATLQSTAHNTTIQLNDTKVDEQSSKSISIKHSHAGTVTLSLSGTNASDFSLSETSFTSTSYQEGRNITIYFKPTCVGERTATLTISSNNGLNSLTVYLKANGLRHNPSAITWVEPINTEMFIGDTRTISVNATTDGSITYTSSDNSIISVSGNTLTANAAGIVTITATQVATCKYNAISITKTFTVSNKKTPTFWLNGNPDQLTDNLKTYDIRTINITNVDGSMTADYDPNLLSYTFNGSTATIQALDAGTATLKLTQPETSQIFFGERTFTFNITKYDTNMLTNDLATNYMVDDAIAEADIYTINNYEVPVQIISGNESILKFENGQLKAVGAGTTTLTVKQPATNKWVERSATKTIIVNKYSLTAHINPSTTIWNSTHSHPISVTITPTNSETLTDFTVHESSNTAIATYNTSSNTVQTYHTSGTAYFQITRPEDYKYNALSQIVGLTVSQGTATCPIVVFNDDQTTYDSNREYAVGYHDKPSGFLFDLSDVGDIINVDVRKQNAAMDDSYLYIIGYDENRQNETTLLTISNSDISTNYTTKTCTISDVTDIKITRLLIKSSSGNIWNDALAKFFKNIRVTRKQYLEPQIEGKDFYLTQTSIRMNFEGTFLLDWSTCADEILLTCDHPSFVITPSRIDASEQKSGTTPITITCRDENATNLVGKVTIYDQTQKADFNVLCKYLMQRIVWNQYFNNLDADEAGNITFQQVLNAYAATVDGTPTGAPVTYTLDENAQRIARLETTNGITTLYITGQGDGKITASIPSIEKDGKIYSADQVTHDIRVRKLGDLCNTTFPLKDRIELHTIQTSEAFDIHEMNAGTLLFTAHRDILGGNEFYVQFSSDYQTSWSDVPVALEGDNDKDFTILIPNGTTHLRFATKRGATLKKYIKQIRVTQKMELKPDTKQINETIYVNTPYEKNIQVAYSDVPIIQTSLTQNTTDQLLLTTNQPITNNCGEFGTYIYTLSGEWTQPQTITETLKFFTSAEVLPQTVNITLYVIIGEQDLVSVKDGLWSDASTWNKQVVPQAYHNVQVAHQITITTHAEVHSLTMAPNASITIGHTGGLDIHAGGYSTANSTADITLAYLQSGSAYLRISPEWKGAKPKVKVRYQTRSTLDTGANKDATWQYIGAPGANCQFTVDYITWLYQWSEPQNWLQQSGTLTLSPFAGYAITQYGQPTYELTAEAITADRTITLTKTPGGMDGNNLFANSYMAPIDAKNFTPEDFSDYGTGREDIEKTFYVFNSGSWNEWNKYNSLGQTIGSNGSTTPGQYCAIPALSSKYLNNTYDITTIPPMQGVYVIAKNDNAAIYLNYQKHVWRAGSTADLSTDMHEPMRAPSHNAYKPDKFRRLRIQINSANSGADRMYVIQDTITTPDYDNGYDAPNQLAEGLANIYTNEHFGQMEISCSNHIDSTFIGFTAGLDSIYTLTFNAIIGNDLHLHDLENDSIILMEEGTTYTFHTTPNSKNDLRFQILIHPEKQLDFEEIEKDAIITGVADVHTTQVWSHGSCIYINNAPANTTATLFNISGNQLLTTPIYHTPYTLDLSYLSKGLYLLQLNSNVYKFIIQ